VVLTDDSNTDNSISSSNIVQSLLTNNNPYRTDEETKNAIAITTVGQMVRGLSSLLFP
jgi:hypothetical protein